MGQPVIQPSFASGELSPGLWARVDLAKFHIGAALLRNFFVDYRGGVSTRAGTAYAIRCLPGINRLFPFTFSTVQTYSLIFSGQSTIANVITGAANNGSGAIRLTVDATANLITGALMTVSGVGGTVEANGTWPITVIDATHVDLYGSAFVNAYTAGGAGATPIGAMRVVMSGSAVLEANRVITGATQANPCKITSVAHGFVTGDWVFVQNVGGMTQLNSKFFIITRIDADNFTLTDLFGNNVNSTAYGAYTAGGTVARIYTMKTPYQASDLALVKYTQSADTMTLTHPSYRPMQLTRTGHAAWTIVPATFAPSVNAPVAPATATPSGAGATTYRYAVTAVTNNGVTESEGLLFSTAASATMSTTAGARVTLAWTAPAKVPQFYNVYRQQEVDGSAPDAGSVYGFIGSTSDAGFVDKNIAPDFTRAPPTGNNPFNAIGNFPSCSTYFQQRQTFGATNVGPQGLNMSKTADFLNMDFSNPSRANDAIQVTLASQQVNAIKHLLAMQSLIALTASGAWRIDSGTQGTPVTPSNIVAEPQAYNGCSDVPPIVINYDILYVQSKGSVVRDLSYNFYVNLYTGADMTVLSAHLVSAGRTIVEWAFAEEPFKIIWAVRSDGVLLSFTYLKEQDVYGWAHHDTDGRFKSVCSISEGNENAVYVIVERLVNGQTVQYVERMASRNLGGAPEYGIPGDVNQAWFVDSGLQFPKTYPAANATPSALTAALAVWGTKIVDGGHGYAAPVATVIDLDPTSTGAGAQVTLVAVAGVITAANVIAQGTNYIRPAIRITDATGSGAVISAVGQRRVNITADAAVFAAGDVGKTMRINGGIGNVVVNVSATVNTIDIYQDLTSLWPALSGAWSMTTPVSSVSGLDHLEGKTVQILANGSVDVPAVVANGTVALSNPCDAITVGLGYTAQLRSLYLDVPGENPTVQGRRKKISAVTLRVENSRGLKVGNSWFDQYAAAQKDGPLREFKERNNQRMGQPVQLVTGDERIVIDPLWSVQGQILVQQDYPLPATVLGMIPEINVGDT